MSKTRTFTGCILAAIAAASALAAGCGDDGPESKVNVSLSSFVVQADVTTVAAGKTEFTAKNTEQKDIHELAVLRVKDDGSYENLGEVEDIDPGKGGSVTIDLKAGKYLLACLIAAGEAGSTEDHFAKGMRLDFTVE